MTWSWPQPVLSVHRTRLLEPTGHLVGSLQLQGVRKGLRHSGVLGIGLLVSAWLPEVQS